MPTHVLKDSQTYTGQSDTSFNAVSNSASLLAIPGFKAWNYGNAAGTERVVGGLAKFNTETSHQGGIYASNAYSLANQRSNATAEFTVQYSATTQSVICYLRAALDFESACETSTRAGIGWMINFTAGNYSLVGNTNAANNLTTVLGSYTGLGLVVGKTYKFTCKIDQNIVSLTIYNVTDSTPHIFAGGTDTKSVDLTTTSCNVPYVQMRLNLVGTTAGTYPLSFAGQTTTALAHGASAATIQSALEALSTIGAGKVTVTQYATKVFHIVLDRTVAYAGYLEIDKTGLTGATTFPLTDLSGCWYLQSATGSGGINMVSYGYYNDDITALSVLRPTPSSMANTLNPATTVATFGAPTISGGVPSYSYKLYNRQYNPGTTGTQVPGTAPFSPQVPPGAAYQFRWEVTDGATPTPTTVTSPAGVVNQSYWPTAWVLSFLGDSHTNNAYRRPAIVTGLQNALATTSAITNTYYGASGNAAYGYLQTSKAAIAAQFLSDGTNVLYAVLDYNAYASYSRTPAQSVADITELIDYIIDNVPSIKLVVLGHIFATWTPDATNGQFLDVIRGDWARQHQPLLNALHGRLKTRGDGSSVRYRVISENIHDLTRSDAMKAFYGGDGTHPTQAGYETIAAHEAPLLAAEIKKELRGEVPGSGGGSGSGNGEPIVAETETFTLTTTPQALATGDCKLQVTRGYRMNLKVTASSLTEAPADGFFTLTAEGTAAVPYNQAITDGSTLYGWIDEGEGDTEVTVME